MIKTDKLLNVSNLTKSFGGIVAVNDVSFYVDEHEIVALIGPNGAGKTTCFNLITGFDRQNSGEVHFKKINLKKQLPSKITSFGMVRTFQHTNIFGSLSVLDNILLGQHIKLKGSFVNIFINNKLKKAEDSRAIKRALELLDLVGMVEERNKLAADLSYGSQKILGILMALACNPKLLALDEPAAGLNAVETSRLTKLIKDINKQGITILVVEHDMKFIMDISTRIIVLAEGKKIAEGSPDAIRNNKLVQNIYFGNLAKDEE